MVLALTGLGLVASFFHLGRPERFWRTATRWKTSWLSREVIALPAFMGGVALWTVLQINDADLSMAVGLITALACLVLWVCTAMGARGLTRAVLCGELLAALVNAEPLPLDARLARAMGTERLEK